MAQSRFGKKNDQSMTYLRFFDINEQNLRWNQRMIEIAQKGVSSARAKGKTLSIVAPTFGMQSFEASPMPVKESNEDEFQMDIDTKPMNYTK